MSKGQWKRRKWLEETVRFKRTLPTICLVNGCAAATGSGEAYCEKHRAATKGSSFQSSIAPPSMAQLMAGSTRR